MTIWAVILMFGVTAIWAALLAAVAYLVTRGPRAANHEAAPVSVVSSARRA